MPDVKKYNKKANCPCRSVGKLYVLFCGSCEELLNVLHFPVEC